MSGVVVRDRVRRSEAEWQALFKAQSVSGLSQQAFCQRNGISVSAFYNARSRLGQHSKPSASGLSDDFVALSFPAQDVAGDWDIELSLGADMVLRIRRP